MKMLNTLTSNAYHDLIDYNVVDQGGDHVGTLHSLWSDQNTGALEFLGVKTGWLFGSNHVVPAEKAQIDEENRFVQIPFAAAFIKEAPSIAADAEITEDQEAEIHRYYGMSGVAGMTPGAAVATTAAAGAETTINDLGRNTGAGTADYPATTGSGTTMREARAGETIGMPLAGEQTGFGGRDVDAGNARLRKTFRPETTELRREEDIEAGRGGSGFAPGSMAATGGYGATGAAATGTFADVTGSDYAERDRRGGVNPDPITGEPGAHPVGTGIGAVSGAATGAAMGLAGGPIGAVIGGVAGAVTGGLIGKGVEEYFDPTEEAAYWRENYRSSSAYDPSMSYEDMEPAYRTGYTAFGKYYGTGKRFEDVEDNIRADYQGSGSRLGYDQARNSVKEAYDRLFHRASSGQRR